MSEPGSPSGAPGGQGGPLAWLLAPVRLVIALVVILDELLRPLYRPVIRWFAGLRLIRRMETAVASLPPFAVLGILAVPVIGVEPLKILALFWLGQGRFLAGSLLMAAAYAGSFLLIERLYAAGEAKLMRIGWFALVMGYVIRIRTAVIAWARSTRSYAAAMAMVRWARELAVTVSRAVRGLVRRGT